MRHLLGLVLLLAPLFGHGQGRTTTVVGAAKKMATAEASEQGTAILTGRVSGATTDSVSVSLRENPLDPKEKLFRVRLSERGEFKLVIPVRSATKADLVYGDDVAPLFLDAGTDIDVRFKGSDLSGTLRFKANDVPTGFATRLRNRANLTDEQRHRQQAANANNYLAESDEQFVENDGFQVLPETFNYTKRRFSPFWNTAASTSLSFWKTMPLSNHSPKSSTTTRMPKWCTLTPTTS